MQATVSYPDRGQGENSKWRADTLPPSIGAEFGAVGATTLARVKGATPP